MRFRKITAGSASTNTWKRKAVGRYPAAATDKKMRWSIVFRTSRIGVISAVLRRESRSQTLSLRDTSTTLLTDLLSKNTERLRKERPVLGWALEQTPMALLTRAEGLRNMMLQALEVLSTIVPFFEFDVVHEDTFEIFAEADTQMTARQSNSTYHTTQAAALGSASTLHNLDGGKRQQHREAQKESSVEKPEDAAEGAKDPESNRYSLARSYPYTNMHAMSARTNFTWIAKESPFASLFRKGSSEMVADNAAFAPFDSCSCVGKGYDYFMAIMQILKGFDFRSKFGLRKQLSDAERSWHFQHLKTQGCANFDFMNMVRDQIFYTDYFHTFRCAPGEMGVNLMSALSCILEEKYTYAMEFLHLNVMISVAYQCDLADWPFTHLTSVELLRNLYVMASVEQREGLPVANATYRDALVLHGQSSLKHDLAPNGRHGRDGDEVGKEQIRQRKMAEAQALKFRRNSRQSPFFRQSGDVKNAPKLTLQQSLLPPSAKAPAFGDLEPHNPYFFAFNRMFRDTVGEVVSAASPSDSSTVAAPAPTSLRALELRSMSRSVSFLSDFFPSPIDRIRTGCRVHAVPQSTPFCVRNNTVLDRRGLHSVFYGSGVATSGTNEDGVELLALDSSRYPNQKGDSLLALDEDPAKGIAVAETVLAAHPGQGSVVRYGEAARPEDDAEAASNEIQAIDNTMAVGTGDARPQVGSLETDAEKKRAELGGTSAELPVKSDDKYQAQDRAWGNHAHGLFLRHAVRRQLKVANLCNEWGRHTLWANTRNLYHRHLDEADAVAPSHDAESVLHGNTLNYPSGDNINSSDYSGGGGHGGSDKLQTPPAVVSGASESVTLGQTLNFAPDRDSDRDSLLNSDLDRLKARLRVKMQQLKGDSHQSRVASTDYTKSESDREDPANTSINDKSADSGSADALFLDEDSSRASKKALHQQAVSFASFLLSPSKDHATRVRTLRDLTWVVTATMSEVNMSHFLLFFLQILSDAPIRIGYEKLEHLFVWISGGTSDGCFTGPEKPVWNRWRAEYYDFLQLIAENVVLLYSFDQVAVFQSPCNEQAKVARKVLVERVPADEWDWREANWVRVMLRDLISRSPENLVLSTFASASEQETASQKTTPGEHRSPILLPTSRSGRGGGGGGGGGGASTPRSPGRSGGAPITEAFLARLLETDSKLFGVLLRGSFSAVSGLKSSKNAPATSDINRGGEQGHLQRHLIQHDAPPDPRFTGCFKQAFIGQHEKIRVHSLQHEQRSKLQVATSRLVIASNLRSQSHASASREAKIYERSKSSVSDVGMEDENEIRNEAEQKEGLEGKRVEINRYRTGTKPAPALATILSTTWNTESRVLLTDPAFEERAPLSLENELAELGVEPLLYGTRPGLFVAGPGTQYRRRLIFFALQRKQVSSGWTIEKAERNFDRDEFLRDFASLRSATKDFAVGVYGHFEERSLQDQLAVVQHSSFFMGSHGAGLAWVAFMSKDHSAVIEILPQQPVVSVQGLCQRQNFWDKNRLAIYGGLARIAGVRHYCQHSFSSARAATNAKRGAEGEAGSSSEYSLAEITASFGLVRKGKVKLDPGAIAKAMKTSPIIM